MVALVFGNIIEEIYSKGYRVSSVHLNDKDMDSLSIDLFGKPQDWLCLNGIPIQRSEQPLNDKDSFVVCKNTILDINLN